MNDDLIVKFELSICNADGDVLFSSGPVVWNHMTEEGALFIEGHMIELQAKLHSIGMQRVEARRHPAGKKR